MNPKQNLDLAGTIIICDRVFNREPLNVAQLNENWGGDNLGI